MEPEETQQLEVEVLVIRGPDGLIGLDIDVENFIAGIVPGSAADIQGVIQIGDLVVACDGVRIGVGQQLREIITPGRPSYKFIISRDVISGPSDSEDSGAAAAGSQNGAEFVAAPAFHLNFTGLQSKHQKLSRAEGNSTAPLDPLAAEKQQAAAPRSVLLTPRSVGRTESEIGLCL
eukprot:2538743-Pleurochrysis_carterae.AAC.2